MFTQYNKHTIATFLALLLHACGLIGILFINRELVTNATGINLLIMFVLLIWTQHDKNKHFFLFIIGTGLLGFLAEWIGVNTSLLFGDYQYGNALGYKFKNVPLIIAVNWVIIIYCSGVLVQTLLKRAVNKITEQSGLPKMRIKAISIIVDGATLAVFFDWIMEPAAIKLGYWHWNTGDGSVPILNYACWFAVSLLLMALFQAGRFSKHNKFAVHLLLIQMMFFLLLRTFL